VEGIFVANHFQSDFPIVGNSDSDIYFISGEGQHDLVPVVPAPGWPDAFVKKSPKMYIAQSISC
jgi:hypothetical protein